MGKNIKGLAGSTIFNQKMVEQMNGINKNKKGKASPIYIPTKKRKKWKLNLGLEKKKK